MIVTKTCKNCSYYNDGICWLHAIPVCIQNSCSKFSIRIEFVESFKFPEIVDYDNYYLDPKRIEDLKELFPLQNFINDKLESKKFNEKIKIRLNYEKKGK